MRPILMFHACTFGLFPVDFPPYMRLAGAASERMRGQYHGPFGVRLLPGRADDLIVAPP